MQDNFSADLLNYIENQKLSKWFSVRDMDDKALQVTAIDSNASSIEQMKALCRVLELEDDEDVITYLLEVRDKRDKEQPKKFGFSDAIDIMNIFIEAYQANKEEYDGKKDKF